MVHTLYLAPNGFCHFARLSPECIPAFAYSSNLGSLLCDALGWLGASSHSWGTLEVWGAAPLSPGGHMRPQSLLSICWEGFSHKLCAFRSAHRRGCLSLSSYHSQGQGHILLRIVSWCPAPGVVSSLGVVRLSLLLLGLVISPSDALGALFPTSHWVSQLLAHEGNKLPAPMRRRSNQQPSPPPSLDTTSNFWPYSWPYSLFLLYLFLFEG